MANTRLLCHESATKILPAWPRLLLYRGFGYVLWMCSICSRCACKVLRRLPLREYSSLSYRWRYQMGWRLLRKRCMCLVLYLQWNTVVDAVELNISNSSNTALRSKPFSCRSLWDSSPWEFYFSASTGGRIACSTVNTGLQKHGRGGVARTSVKQLHAGPRMNAALLGSCGTQWPKIRSIQ